jgi:hypothetical protein
VKYHTDEFKIIWDEDPRDLSTTSNIARRVKCGWLRLTSSWLEREMRGMNRVSCWGSLLGNNF